MLVITTLSMWLWVVFSFMLDSVVKVATMLHFQIVYDGSTLWSGLSCGQACVTSEAQLLSCWGQQETAGYKLEEGEDTLIHYSRTLLLPPYTTLNLLFSWFGLRVTPLPIPNREVKLKRSNDTGLLRKSSLSGEQRIQKQKHPLGCFCFDSF